jgi:hypothetical protein
MRARALNQLMKQPRIGSESGLPELLDAIIASHTAESDIRAERVGA